MRFLLCSDGTPVGVRSLAYGLEVARAAGANVTLLGIVADAGREARLRQELEAAQHQFPAADELRIQTGKPAHGILAEANARPYDLVIMGSRGLRGWQRIAFGSVAARLARYSPIPVLIVKGERWPIRRVLACTSGDVRGERVARWGGQVASWFQAESTILHVMSQIPLSPTANLDELENTAEEAIQHHTREGRHLERELDLMRSHAAAVTLMPKIRHGPVIEEITAEIKEGNYDLLVIGGHQAPDFGGSRVRVRDYLLEDVADQIIMAIDRPVLVIKGP